MAGERDYPDWFPGALAAQDAYQGAPPQWPPAPDTLPQDPFERAALTVRRANPYVEKPEGYAKGLEALATVAPMALAPFTGIPAALASLTPRAAATMGAIAAPVGAAMLEPTAQRAWEQNARLQAGFDYDPSAAVSLALTGAPAAKIQGEPNTIGSAGGKPPRMGDIAEPAAIEPPSGIRAYHGSPHDFERFDISKIGTGEGGQAYGHGLYFAENPATAKAYRERLSANAPYLRGGQQILHPDLYNAMEASALSTGIHPDQAGQITRQILKLIEKEGSSAKVYGGYEAPKGFERAWDAALDTARDIKWNTNPGKTYEVNINARPEQMLNYDVPIKEQSNEVQKALGSYFGGAYLETPNIFPQSLVPSGAVSAKSLREAGIPGIRYLDQGSRFAVDPKLISDVQRRIAYADQIGASPEAKQKLIAELTGYQDKLKAQTSNYVLFDDKLIDILRKYGLAGMLGGGAAMGATARQDQYAQ